MATIPVPQYRLGEGKAEAGFDVETGQGLHRRFLVAPRLFDTFAATRSHICLMQRGVMECDRMPETRGHRGATATDDDIDAAMTDICRCGTYQRIRAAIHRAAGQAAADPAATKG